MSGATVSGHIDAVIAAAEQAASGIRRDAEAEAQTYLAESKRRADGAYSHRAQLISDLTDPLVQQAASLRREFEALNDALEDGRLRLSGIVAQTGPSPAPQIQQPDAERAAPARAPVAAERPHESSEAVATAPNEEPPGHGPVFVVPSAQPQPAPKQLDRARLAAMQMAVSGSGRSEIAERLRREFGVSDPRPILDELADSFGL